MDVDDKQREKWIEVFKLQYMSSEESEDENTLKVKPIFWLSSRVNEFKRSLDKERTKTLNSQSKRQAKQKIEGETSQRIKPDGSKWLFKKQKNPQNLCSGHISSIRTP